MKINMNKAKADAEVQAAIDRVLTRDLPDDPAEYYRELHRRREEMSQDVNTNTLAVLESLAAEVTGNLDFFGRDNADLERQILAWTLNHGGQPFMAKLIPHLTPELFNDFAVARLMRIVLGFHERYGVTPTRAMVRSALGKTLTTDEFELYERYAQALDTDIDPKTLDFIRDSEVGVLAQLKQRAYERVIEGGQLGELVVAKEYAQLDAIFAGCFPEPDAAEVISLKGDLDAILAPDHIQSLGTGYAKLDREMHEGGPARGEVLVFLANTGVGKTTMLLNCARHQVAKGLNVLYVVLEGTTKAVAQRMASLVANAPTRTLADHAAMAKRVVGSLPGDVRFVAPTEEVWTARHVQRKLEFLRSTDGFQPDVVIIDYAKFLKSTNVAKQDQEYVKLAKVMDEVKRLAMDTDCLVITAQQANREGESQDTVGLKHAAGSYDALQPVDYCVSINQTVLEGVRNEIRLAINKNRHGREQVVVTCTINRASGLVEEK